MKTLLLLVCSMTASAALIFDNTQAPQYTTLRNDQGIAAYLEIGGSDISINQIAINVAPAVAGQLKFVIFSDVAYPGNDSGTLLFSDTVNVAASSNQGYVLSDPFAFTLKAGQYYDVGAIFNGGNISYGYDFLGDTMNGITSISRNENIGQFANPALLGHGLADADIQLFSNAGVVPEPATFVLEGLAAAFGFIVVARRQR